MVDKGYGTRFFWGVTSTPVTEIVQLVDVSSPAIDVDDIDTSIMQSTDQYRTFIAGWKDGGETNLVVQYAKAVTATLFAELTVENYFKVQFSDGSFWQWQGYIKGFSNEIEIDDIVRITLTIKINGVPAFTPSA